VNLVGDHTDYNGLPVLPMALERSVRILVRPRSDGRVRVRSLEWPAEEAVLAPGSDLGPTPAGHWSNYVAAALHGVHKEHHESRGFDGLIVSDVPVAAGLSSSSALVVASTLALVRLPALKLAALAARSERWVGTQGGAMDQTVSACASAGHALYIRFDPLRIHSVPVPPSWRFVVANSGIRAEKSGGMRQAYNDRVQACRAALERIGRHIGTDRALSYAALRATVPADELDRLSTRLLGGFELQCFRHTTTEASRVEDAVVTMEAGDAAAFAACINRSHASLRDDYGVSLEALDELVTEARSAGALGARLTGAGFGGCVVAFTDAQRMSEVRGALVERLTQQGQAEPVVFEARPGPGAQWSAIS